MKQFKDAKGDTWTVEVNGATVKRVKEHLKGDLGDLEFLSRCDAEIALKVDLLYVVCLPEADKRGIQDIDFAAQLGGEALFDAMEVLWESLIDFFQKLRRTDTAEQIREYREKTAQAIELQRKIVVRAAEELGQKMEGDELGTRIDDAIKTLGKSFVNSLRLPESIPNGERSEK